VKSIREAVLEEYIDGIDEYERIEVFSDKVIVKPAQPAHLHDPASPTLLPAPNLPILAPVTALTTSLTPITAEVNIV
jgi:hypothetical protein